jgi:hypothetical protein
VATTNFACAPEGSGQAGQGLEDPEGAGLDLHEGIDNPDGSQTGCGRWPTGLRLRNELTGELVTGRCRATNLCAYCQRLYVVETVEMLTLDALEHAPTIWVVLTAREHLTRAECRRHLDVLLRSARRRWPVEWFVQVEFQRRGALHLNLLIKGVPTEAREELHELLSKRWCARVDALPVGQWAGEVSDAGGVVRYLSKMLAHGLKAEQAPPLGWRGHRTSQTRGYLVRPAAMMRRQAREAIQLKRELWKAIEAGQEAHDAELTARAALQLAARSVWTLANERGVRLGPTTYDPRRMVISAPRQDHLTRARASSKIDGYERTVRAAARANAVESVHRPGRDAAQAGRAVRRTGGP